MRLSGRYGGIECNVAALPGTRFDYLFIAFAVVTTSPYSTSISRQISPSHIPKPSISISDLHFPHELIDNPSISFCFHQCGAYAKRQVSQEMDNAYQIVMTNGLWEHDYATYCTSNWPARPFR